MQREAAPGLFTSARRLFAGLVDVAHTRLDLLGTELHEELARLGVILLIPIVALFFAFLGVGFLAISAVLVVDESNRPMAALLLGLGFVTVGAVGAWWMRRITRQKRRVFEASLTELRKDRDLLMSD